MSNIPYSFSHDFKNYTSQSSEYAYDLNGNFTKDLNRGVSLISYNVLNLPSRLDVKSPVGEARNEYVYRSDGNKLRVVHKWNPNYSTAPVIGSGVTESSLTKSETTDYVGNYVYINNALKRTLTENGYIENGAYYFYIKDHLGNNRITTDASATRKQTLNYYPYGMQYGDALGSDVQPYRYGGKEYDLMHGLNVYDFEARYYDPALGRFMMIDPLAEKYYSWSPYGYCFNNPLRYVDPTGMSPNDDERDRGWKSLFDNLLSTFNNLFSIEIDARSPETLSRSAAQHERKIQTLEKTVDVINTTNETLSFAPFSSFAEITANASEGNYNAALAAVSFAVLDLASMGKGKIVKTALKTSTGIEIKGFVKHGLNRVIERNIKPESIIDAIRNPIKVSPIKIDDLGRQSQRFVGASSEIVINPISGNIISVNPTSSQKVRSLLKIK